MKHTSQKHQQGFTLIELLLAMSFLTFILLFMVMATVQLMRSYNKGLVDKQINQVGRTTLEDITRTIRTSGSANANVNVLNQGRFCIGGTSYVWNVRDDTTNKDTNNQVVGLVSVNDPGASMCGASLPNVPAGQATTLLTSSVWVQKFTVQPSLDSQLLNVTLTLSTAGDNQPTNTNGQLDCGPDSIGQYCAFASFNTTVYTRSGGTQ